VTPLPEPLGNGELIAWRIDRERFGPTWDGGEGAYRFGGRWNSKGVRAVYCSLDPATAVLEVAAHLGFAEMAAIPHVLTAVDILSAADVHVVHPDDVPVSDWLRPGFVSPEQQKFGDALLNAHKFVIIPSAVSSHSWNLIFIASAATGAYKLRLQEPFSLDARLHPPA
jgi:RES domain-containing protein